MKKIFLLSLFLIVGLVGSQTIPHLFATPDSFATFKHFIDTMLYTSLAYIMINVGREFILEKENWRSYTTDYFIAMATAAGPWLMICLYFMFIMPDGSFGDWDAWKENLLLSRFAAPTSAGILFTMLAAAGLKQTWIYKKTQVLAIFDDLDTILLMIPLQVFMIGLKWQLGVIIFLVFIFLWIGWKKLDTYKLNQSWWAVLGYAVVITAICQAVYVASKAMFGAEGSIHIEVLLPAFVLGMVIKTDHNTSIADENASSIISYIFMMLVGMSAPLFVGVDSSTVECTSQIAQVPAMGWGEIAMHVAIVTFLSNLGKMFPMLAYRDRSLKERLALSVGMFTRGEVGAGVIFIAIGYGLGGPLLTISLLTIVANLLLTGGFVMIVKKLSLDVSKEQQAIAE